MNDIISLLNLEDTDIEIEGRVKLLWNFWLTSNILFCYESGRHMPRLRTSNCVPLLTSNINGSGSNILKSG